MTKRILYDDAWVDFLYREAPDNETDSGWCITANDESEDYMDSADRWAFVSLGSVISRDDSFIHLLDAAIGTAFVRDTKTGEFAACDFPPE